MDTPRTVDLTPTWSAILPLLLMALKDGQPDAQAVAKEEMERMAQLADIGADAVRMQRQAQATSAIMHNTGVFAGEWVR